MSPKNHSNTSQRITPREGEFLFYTTPNGGIKIEALFRDESIWMTQKRLAELFDVDRSVIAKHIINIYDAGELRADATCAKIAQVQKEGTREVSREIDFYNLDAIISVGYRVNSVQATAFRTWATATLREFLVKGFVMDDERLKNGQHFGKDYFDELLERVREIRLSERRLHLKLTDILALASDYSAQAILAQEFFAFIQNKLHYAITGATAAELITERADSKQPRMGLTSWKCSPEGKILQSDVVVAKNYLNSEELQQLARAVSAFLDIAENRASQGKVMTMKDWIGVMNGYLDLNDYPRLSGAGTVSKDTADAHAIEVYKKFRVRQDREHIGDFERAIKNIEKSADDN